MKIPQWIYIGTIGVLLILLFFRGCDKDIESTTTTTTTKPVKVEIPAQEGNFKTPTSKEELPFSQPDTVFIGGEPIYLPSPLNEELQKELAKTKTEAEKYKLLADAARQRQYLQSFEDDFVKIDVKSDVFGTLNNNEINYKLKPREVTVNETTIEKTMVKNDKFGMLGLAGASKNLSTQEMIYEAGAGIRLGKVSVLATGATNKTVGIKAIIEF